MVDTSAAMESSFVTTELVQKSATKKLVVVDPGTYETSKEYGEKLTLGVNIDGKQKKWRPNKETVKNLQVLGNDSVTWVGKVIDLSIETRTGKLCVIGKAAQ